MAVDWRSGKPALGTGIGGLSGPAIKPIAMRMVWEVARSVEIPVIAIGGVTTVDDVLEYMCVGACAVQVGTAHYRTPDIIPRLVGQLRTRLAEAGHGSVRDVIGTVRTA
jgi:dihydroorotate dehydrogenase (NAD+) catalytic subunit